MAVSQNGWPASAITAEIGIESCAAAGVLIGDGLARGPVTTVLIWVAAEFHRRVELLALGWCWGYKYKPIAGGGGILSNHASGTAIDLNAPKHPLGQAGTFTVVQVAEIHAILAELGGVVRWGGDYTGRVDPMHFEINADAAQVAAVARRLGAAMQILDYSRGYPGGAAVAAAGYGGVVRYLRKEGTSAVQPITPVEFADMRAHGRDVALVHQHVDKARVQASRAAGLHDALWARDRALELGGGEPRAIYFAVDFDAVPSTVEAYFTGCCDALGVTRVGVYGSYRVVGHLLDAGLVRWLWQTTAWSHGLLETRAHLFQRLGTVKINGVDCDVNDVLKTDFGQYGAGNNPTGGDFLMALTGAEQAAMRDQLAYMVQGKGGAWPQGDQAKYESEQFDTLGAVLVTLTTKVDALTVKVDQIIANKTGL